MKERGAVANLRNELNCAAEIYRHGEEQMKADGDIAYAVAGNVPVSHALIPRRPIPASRQRAIEKDYVGRKDQLADQRHNEPRLCCHFQRAFCNRALACVRGQSRGQYRRTHRYSPYGQLRTALKYRSRAVVLPRFKVCSTVSHASVVSTLMMRIP